MINIAAVASGGAAGAVARYLCQTVLATSPLGVSTAVVNIVGSLLIGVTWSITRHLMPSALWSLLLVTGFLGGFTTFSTFTLDAFKLIERGAYMQAVVYVVGSVVVSLIACVAGIVIVDRILS